MNDYQREQREHRTMMEQLALDIAANLDGWVAIPLAEDDYGDR